MTHLYKVDLPAPSSALIEIAKRVILTTGTTRLADQRQGAVRNLKSIYGEDANIMNHYFGNRVESLELTNQLRAEYSKFFPGMKFKSHYGFMHGDYDTTGIAKSHPPHADVARNINLNFYIDLGGDDVQTWFYDKYGAEDRTSVLQCKKSELVSLGYCNFDADAWYLFDGSQVHSVENVKGLRYFIAILLIDEESKARPDMLAKHTNLRNKFVNSSDEGRSTCTVPELLDIWNSINLPVTKIELKQ